MSRLREEQRAAMSRLREEQRVPLSTTSVPDRAQVVVIGGGVIGTSVAYHLTKLRYTDVILLEQGQLSSGTSDADPKTEGDR